MCKCTENKEITSGCGCSTWKKYLLIGLLVAAAVAGFFYFRNNGRVSE